MTEPSSPDPGLQAPSTRETGAVSQETISSSQELINRELNHRIKNIFAVVSALISVSARRHPEARAFADTLRTRIQALSRAHDFVRPYTDEAEPGLNGATLHAFLRDLMAPYGEGVLLEGQDAVFDDQSATPLALLFHELATNAVKYGALSEPSGRVTIRTGLEQDTFVLEWSEAGGPPVHALPDQSGFGSVLSRLAVEGQLGGRLEQTWRPSGLLLRAVLPVTALSRRRHAEELRRNLSR